VTDAPAYDARAVFVDSHVAGWLAARRYGMPARMVADATARREAGDWRGACAAARVDVRFDVADVRRRHGFEVAAALADDLAHLAPDLVRWHLPRQGRGGSGLLRPEREIPLARYAAHLSLYLRTPASMERPQRPELHVGPLREHYLRTMSWTTARYLWDARAAHLLLERLGGGDRAPFFHRDGRSFETPGRGGDAVALAERILLLQDAGRIDEAWRAGGVTADFAPIESYYRPRPDLAFPEPLGAMVAALAPAARRALSQPGAPETVVLQPSDGWIANVVTVRLTKGRLTATRVQSFHARALPRLSRTRWQRFPDLELLRTGRIAPAELHPLVRAAVFPDQPDPGYRPRVPDADTEPLRVRCRGGWHRVGWRDHRVDAPAHSPDEAQREEVIRSLGGGVPGCFAVTEAWRGRATARLPGTLRRLRAHALAALAHGDTDTFVRVLDAGVDPAGIHDRWRRTPLHYLAKVDGEPLLARLLDAGLDLNARDDNGRTPLCEVLFDGGPASLFRAMVDAGADPLVVEKSGASTLHMVRSIEAADIVPWLLAAGLDVEAYDGDGRTPLMYAVSLGAPPEAVRALLAAGANPAGRDMYGYDRIRDLIRVTDRDDLGFLTEAAKPNPEEER
jgi:hypothetical protein